MNKTIKPTKAAGITAAIPSKSVAHRLLICAALADKPCRIACPKLNKDIEATTNCLRALGAEISYAKGEFEVTPLKQAAGQAQLNCGESGSTLRFLLPLAAALGTQASFKREGRLAQRPLAPLDEVLKEHGAVLSDPKSEPLTLKGQLTGGDYQIDGGVSSQYISGLLFALPLLKEQCTLKITGKIESLPYIDLTVNALKAFGIELAMNEQSFLIKNDLKYTAPQKLEVEGDWSNAAFFLAMGALGSIEGVTVTNLNLHSAQGDKEIAEILNRFGAKVTADESLGTVTVQKGDLHAIEIDAAQIPDLVPILAIVAAKAQGTTRIYNASRLRLKESDRLAAIRLNLNALGGQAEETDDGLLIHGTGKLKGGRADSFNDHRMVMSAAAAALISEEAVTVSGAEAVEKSYPAFWQDLAHIYEKGAVIDG